MPIRRRCVRTILQTDRAQQSWTTATTQLGLSKKEKTHEICRHVIDMVEFFSLLLLYIMSVCAYAHVLACLSVCMCAMQNSDYTHSTLQNSKHQNIGLDQIVHSLPLYRNGWFIVYDAFSSISITVLYGTNFAQTPIKLRHFQMNTNNNDFGTRTIQIACADY